MSVPKISIRGLRKRFGGRTVLDGVDLDIAAGTSVVVIGGSGTGKSVLLKCLLGLIAPDAGEITFDGVKRRDRPPAIGMLFQNAALFDSLPVWENVAFGLLAQRMARTVARARAIALLGRVGLGAEVADLLPASLSGGMQKRVGLARAIATAPDILFFDEPTTGLDPIMGAVIDGLIADCVRADHRTALAITHDLASAARIGDRIAMLHQGRIVWQGPPADLYRSGNPVVDQFAHGRRDGPIAVAH